MAPGMKTHSDSSFNESKEVSILKLLLESKKSIKTFFGENEKTPKLYFSFFRFKERLNGGQQCSCEQVDLIIRYTCGVLFLSRHFFPIAFSPFQRLFSCG